MWTLSLLEMAFKCSDWGAFYKWIIMHFPKAVCVPPVSGWGVCAIQITDEFFALLKKKKEQELLCKYDGTKPAKTTKKCRRTVY